MGQNVTSEDLHAQNNDFFLSHVKCCIKWKVMTPVYFQRLTNWRSFDLTSPWPKMWPHFHDHNNDFFLIIWYVTWHGIRKSDVKGWSLCLNYTYCATFLYTVHICIVLSGGVGVACEGPVPLCTQYAGRSWRMTWLLWRAGTIDKRFIDLFFLACTYLYSYYTVGGWGWPAGCERLVPARRMQS